MEKTIPISSQRLKSRRQELKKRRRLRVLAATIRTLTLTGFAAGLFWFVTLPNWVISNGDQIFIEGNQYLSKTEIRKLIPLSYPQPLLKLSVAELKANLKTKAPFEDVIINRSILPPTISINIVERKPVAIAYRPSNNSASKGNKIEKIGYLDSQGVFISQEYYQKIPAGLKLPTLKIIGFPEQYSRYWQDLYFFIKQSEVKITEINWRDPQNLILKTELGAVHMGAFTSKFPEQLSKLAEMKGLSRLVPLEQIIYIDLIDPQEPSIKQKTPPPEV
jgi:cell division protein FtsQ